MATPLEQWWTVSTDNSLSAEMRASLLEAIRSDAYQDIGLPLEIAGTNVVITSLHVNGTMVECYGTGNLSWPLRMYSPPVGIPDPDGVEVAPDGLTWRSDPAEVIARAVWSV